MNMVMNEYLAESVKDKLYGYQIDKLNRAITDYLIQNKESDVVEWRVCPKCHTQCDSFSPGGYTKDKNGNRKKAMLKCPECKRRFVKDHGQLTFYSHSDSSVWNKLIQDTFDQRSLQHTAADIDRHVVTVFHMRHKFLAAVEAANNEMVLNGVTEADEKYVHECHKGLVNAMIDHQNKLIVIQPEPKKKIKAGLGNDKTCIITAVQREAGSFIHTQNMGKPTSENLSCLGPHITEGSYVFTDGSTAYESVLQKKNCPYKALAGIDSYDSLNHLNNVNSLHSRISEWIRNYRNVNTIYINRYNGLFMLRQRFTGADLQEIVINVLRWLRNRVQFLFIRQQMKNIFDDPVVMKCRENLTSIVTVNRLKSKLGYKVVYTYAN